MMSPCEMTYGELVAHCERLTGVARLPENPSKRAVTEWWVVSVLMLELQACGDPDTALACAKARLGSSEERGVLDRLTDSDVEIAKLPPHVALLDGISCGVPSVL